MGRNSGLEQRYCKKHPSHRQSKGVCPSCLRERLSHLSASSSSSADNHSDSSTCSSLSPCYSSDSNLSSACESPPLRGMSKNKSFSSLFGGERKQFKKSKSLAFVVEEKERKKKKKNGTFWSKLFVIKRKEEWMFM